MSISVTTKDVQLLDIDREWREKQIVLTIVLWMYLEDFEQVFYSRTVV